MGNWLVAHAQTNIWCKPSNDRRWIVKPGRLSAPEGETFGMEVQRYSIRLPEKGKWFHVFQLGAFTYRELGISDLSDKWVSFKDVVNTFGTLITVYNDLGRTLPLNYCWMRKQPNGNVIMAVERVGSQVDFSVESLYVRFYDGAFRHSPEYTEAHKSQVYGQIVSNVAVRQTVVNKFNGYRNNYPGEPSAYVNGYEVDILTTADIALWDYVEIVYDGLVESIEYFDVSKLSTFTSELDGTRKYLVHPEKQIDTIHFINDIDFSVLKDNRGVFFHQHMSNSVRQVTHNDYSVGTFRLNEYVVKMDGWNSTKELTLKLVIRRSGMDKPLIFTHNRIQELYKLKDAEIVSAICGINSVVEEWRGSVLEQSSYNRIMAASYGNITNELCTDAYGYNAVSKYVADTPNKTELDAGVLVAFIAPLLARNCTVYEYDIDGLLLGYYNHTSDYNSRYVCRNAAAAMVECIEGQGGVGLDVTWDATTFKVDLKNNYRFYTNLLLSGEEADVFEDVTGTDAYTVGFDGTITWNVDLSRRRPVVVSDVKFLTYGLEIPMTDGHAKFSIDLWEDDNKYAPMQFQPETMEIWMNGRALVPDIDYYYKWPQVVVCNKEYLEDGANRHKPWFDIRCRGLADKVRPPKVGFVVNGLLSNDTYFDVKDDKVIQITVGGSVRHREDVVFREDGNVGISDVVNGRPWMVNDATIPLRDIVSKNTYSMRDVSRDLDKRINAYLNNFIPTPTGIEFNPIPNLYKLFSPIMNKVIHDMINGDLALSADDDLYYISTSQFDKVMLEYVYLLDYEPILLGADLRYVIVHPHDGLDVIDLTPLQMAMIDRLNDRYLANKVIINKLLQIKA